MDLGAIPGPCPLGDLASCLPHLQRQFAPGEVRFGTTRAQTHVSSHRKVFRARQGGRGWGAVLYRKWDGCMDGSVRQGAAVLPSWSPGRACSWEATSPTVQEVNLGRGTVKTQT